MLPPSFAIQPPPEDHPEALPPIIFASLPISRVSSHKSRLFVVVPFPLSTTQRLFLADNGRATVVVVPFVLSPAVGADCFLIPPSYPAFGEFVALSRFPLNLATLYIEFGCPIEFPGIVGCLVVEIITVEVVGFDMVKGSVVNEGEWKAGKRCRTCGGHKGNDVFEVNVPRDAAEEWPAPKQIHSYYFVSWQPYEDPTIKSKIYLLDKEITKKNRAQFQITEALKAKRVSDARPSISRVIFAFDYIGITHSFILLSKLPLLSEAYICLYA
ncbi:hypothetical protein V8G54_037181 [Vigna mungo]|uniref:Uncharacterized protein n=1 Tax=Vigna mungo TaxID=3915 RepID=A0AAQ3MIF0_VIGMU